MKRLLQPLPALTTVLSALAGAAAAAAAALYTNNILAGAAAGGAVALAAAVLSEWRLNVAVEAIARLSAGDRFVELPSASPGGLSGRLFDAAAALQRQMVEADALDADRRSREHEARLHHAARLFFTRRFRETMEEVLHTFGAATEQIEGTASELTERNRRMHVQIDEASRITGSAAASIEAVAGAANDLLRMIATSAAQVAAARDASLRTTEDLTRADDTVRGLSAAAQRIDEVIKMIQSIADGTSLLALNAHIEAARAGDAGRGFAVVASEVKSLAGQTAKATGDIGTQVHGIQDAVRHTVESIDEISVSVAAMGDANRLLAETLDKQIREMREISRRAGEVADGVRSALPAIQSTATQVDSASRAVLDTTGRLQDRSHSIMELIRGYFADLDGGSIKIGILHSISGTMTASERPLQMLLVALTERLNAEGGLLGRPVEAVILNPRSDWKTYAEQAEAMLRDHGVAAIFGCWSSASRKQVLPVIERANGLLFYPSQYEGEEQSPNVVYTGGTPRQQALPATDFLLAQGCRRFFLVGTDYIYPRKTNAILRAYLASRGISGDAVADRFTLFGETEWAETVAEIRRFAAAGNAAVISTVTGDANLHFFRALARGGLPASALPVMSLTIGEPEIAALPRECVTGRYVAWNYLHARDTPENARFVAEWRKWAGNDRLPTNDPMEATWIGFQFWSSAVRRAGTTETGAVREAMREIEVPAPSGFTVRLDPATQHLHKPAMIGLVDDAGRIRPVWVSDGLIPPEPWSQWSDDERARGGEAAPVQPRLPERSPVLGVASK